MQIYINDEEMDFTLENETVLGELFVNLNDWLIHEGCSIKKAIVDGETLDLKESQLWVNRSLPEISRIDLDIEKKGYTQVERLQTMRNFFSCLLTSLDRENRALFNDLMAEYPHIKQAIGFMNQRPGPHFPNSLVENLDKLLEESRQALEKGPLPEQAPVILALEQLLVFTEELIREISEPATEIKVCAAGLKEIGDQLKEATIYLQTGQDQKAMASVVGFAEMTQKIIRLYINLKSQGRLDYNNLTISEQSFAAYHHDLNQTLNELTEAFKAGDSVLIGDLLEYEIAPRLDSLTTFLNSLEIEQE